MNWEEGLEILDAVVFHKNNRHLKDVEIIILQGSWQGLSYDEIATNEGYAAKYLRQDVGFKLWKLLSEALGEEVSKTNFRAAIERYNFRNINILPTEVHHDSYSTIKNEFALEYPEGLVPLNSAFYIQRFSTGDATRTPIEERCYETILQAGSLIRIKAPKQMGKTSLLERIIAHSNQRGYYTVRLNLLQAEATVFNNLDKFLRCFCAYVSHKLKLPTSFNESWDEYRGSIINCTTYFEDYILNPINKNLVLALDEVDRVFQYPEISQGFFAMLRSWHEEAKTVEIWEKLRLAVVHSTENYGSLDINQSPFNVGLVVELTEFAPEQIEDLAQRHKLNYNPTQVQQLMSMFGGHPYLIRLALYHLAVGDITLENLLQTASTNAGIYEEHLRRFLHIFQVNPSLAEAFMQVVTATEPVDIETIQAYQLYSMGLVKRVGDKLVPRCQLYQQYFREHLKI
ncbi:serine/threonine protein kinase [Fischerella thermalis CCMEE 5268]|uniref:Serine/threonine protein kinase n=1 Tax=Fischerella thermalis CCMEE 5268 TaxID=2019662 RepID=A0A2N6KKF3_9CYAN|nr:AAA-like domain-containing protein [Fischerella thermalis]PMB00151.1 serine/threonine protein kinase [Fischerella thermalis CCMEE 5268]